jgi:predicted MPP superfamily phosphohydrolase
VTYERYLAAQVAFHAMCVAFALAVLGRWRDPARAQASRWKWSADLGATLLVLSLATYMVSLVAPLLANLDEPKRLKLGAISGRLMSQALFGELVVLLACLAVLHFRAHHRARSSGLLAAAALLLAVYVDGFHIEPRRIELRRHEVGTGLAADEAVALRILHVTDLQTPSIGWREERALAMGLASRPDLIVLTGDYVQDELGRPTEAQAMTDLRALMTRIGFDAPLGVFATEGDAGPSCREVFAGTRVQCLIDASTRVVLPDGTRLAITGLSRQRGRERSTAWLGWLLGRAPPADHHLVVSHAPDFVDALPAPAALVLAGHTHGGQVVIPFFGPPITASRLPRRFAGGLHDFQGTPLHVSRGVGMERDFTVPIRLNCPPEVCVLDVRLRRTARDETS